MRVTNGIHLGKFTPLTGLHCKLRPNTEGDLLTNTGQVIEAVFTSPEAAVTAARDIVADAELWNNSLPRRRGWPSAEICGSKTRDYKINIKTAITMGELAVVGSGSHRQVVGKPKQDLDLLLTQRGIKAGQVLTTEDFAFELRKSNAVKGDYYERFDCKFIEKKPQRASSVKKTEHLQSIGVFFRLLFPGDSEEDESTAPLPLGPTLKKKPKRQSKMRAAPPMTTHDEDAPKKPHHDDREYVMSVDPTTQLNAAGLALLQKGDDAASRIITSRRSEQLQSNVADIMMNF
jgi:hypothetical protein